MVSWLPLLAESILRLAHLIVLRATKHSIVVFAIVIEYLLLLSFLLVLLEGFDDLILLLASLLVFQVIHIELVLQIVNIGVLLNINVVISLQLSLKPLVLLLILRFHILQTLQPLLDSLQL